MGETFGRLIQSDKHKTYTVICSVVDLINKTKSNVWFLSITSCDFVCCEMPEIQGLLGSHQNPEKFFLYVATLVAQTRTISDLGIFGRFNIRAPT